MDETQYQTKFCNKTKLFNVEAKMKEVEYLSQNDSVQLAALRSYSVGTC